MRRDAKTLLDRLDRQQFVYHDFTEVAEEIELWPLFQALLRDTRVVGARTLPEAKDQSARPVDDRVTALREAAKEPVETNPVASLFDRYRETAATDVIPDRQEQPSLREFLPQIGRNRA